LEYKKYQINNNLVDSTIIRATQEIIRAIRQMIRTIVRMVFAWIIWNSP